MKRTGLILILLFVLSPVIAAEPSADWLSTVQSRIADSEYEITMQDQGLQAPNRSHNLRTYFGPNGIRVVPRTGDKPSWEWMLTLEGYGRGDQVGPVNEPRLVVDGNRIELDRGSIVEWYINDRSGLEQGFTLHGPPAGEEDGPAFLDLALGGSLHPNFSTDGQAIDFRAPGGGNVLHYSKLIVTDATGRELDAWMEGIPGGIRIAFDDSDAAYPVIVDPLATSASWTAEGDQAAANFGETVATAGDVNGDGYSDVMVGAYRYDNGQADEGRVFVYHGSALGVNATPDWTAESDQADAWFGISVSTAGDVDGDGYSDVVIGANLFDGTLANEGRAYLYHGSPSGLSTTPDWTVDGGQANAEMGHEVGVAGDVDGDGFSDVIIGAPFYDNDQTDEGRVFVYHGSAGGLSTTPDWTAESDQASSRFGTALGTAGDVNGDGFSDIIVGAYRFDNPNTDEGRAFVYHGSGTGLNATPAWTAEGDQDVARFAWSVSTAGDVNGDGFSDVIIGARFYDNGELNEGQVFVYHGSASGLNVLADWTAEGDQASAEFGYSVGTAGDVNGDGYGDVIVGARVYDNVEVDEGRAFAYFGSATGLNVSPDWTAESDQASAQMGTGVGTAGDVNGDGYSDVIVGAGFYDNTGIDEGRAFVFHGGPGEIGRNDAWVLVGDQGDGYLGDSVSSAGDVNGDGYSDIIIGAYGYDSGGVDEGKVFVFHGSNTGITIPVAWFSESGQNSSYFGYSVSSAGDVNGDGYGDVMIGAYGYDSGLTDEGAAFLYLGSPSGLESDAAWSGSGGQAGAYFGRSVSDAGDVNNDGYGDVLVGAPYFDDGELDEGKVFLFLGAATGLEPVPSWTAQSDQAEARFGYSVSSAGDFDGNGYSDVIIGAPWFDNGEIDEGRAYMYSGSASGLVAVPALVKEPDVGGANFGFSVAGAGDVNGDGLSDVVVGAPDQNSEGRVSLYYGTSSWIIGSSASLGNFEHLERFGHSVAAAGDTNGDGFADFLVGAPNYWDGGLDFDQGRAYLYYGSVSAIGLTKVTIGTGSADSQFGRSVAGAGDVNGDGFADVLVGTGRDDTTTTNAGSVQLFYGNGGRGPSINLRQRRADDTAPVVHGGRSREPGSYRIASDGRTPFGRGDVRLEWEVKPQGVPFDGAGTALSDWQDTGTGASWNEPVSGLEPGAHRWRARLHYDPARYPFQRKGPWLSMPSKAWSEPHLTISPFVGGQVWEDEDGDGIKDAGETELAGVLIYLLDGAGANLQSTVTGAGGIYRFEVGASGSYRVRFMAPADWTFTLQDQGIDDLVDSDAHTVTGETALFGPSFDSDDEIQWSAGLRRVGLCIQPDEPVYVYAMTVTADGNAYPVLHFQDPNQPGDVTGYNVYRSSDPGLPVEQWPTLADDVVDMDEAEPNRQYVDTTGDVSPSGTWYYQVAANNHVCPAGSSEGPM